jgi:hypothetical protein
MEDAGKERQKANQDYCNNTIGPMKSLQSSAQQ